MPFTKQGLQINRGTTTAHAQGRAVSVEHSYLSEDIIAAISAPGYFPDNFVIADSGSPNVTPQTTVDEILINDTLFIKGNDGAILVVIQSLVPVTLSGDLFAASGSLLIGAPIAATDDNSLTFDGTTLKAEFADATHNGILSTTTQEIGGTKIINGVSVGGQSISLNPNGFPDVYWNIQGGGSYLNYAPNTYLVGSISGAGNLAFYSSGLPLVNFSPAVTQLGLSGTLVNIDASSSLTFANGGGTIGLYQEFVDPAFQFTGPWASPQTTLIIVRIINDSVTIFLDALPAAAATSATVITASTPLPGFAIPLTTKTGFVKVLDNTTSVLGTYFINTLGIITIGVGAAGAAFTNAGSAAMFNLEANYNTL